MPYSVTLGNENRGSGRRRNFLFSKVAGAWRLAVLLVGDQD